MLSKSHYGFRKSNVLVLSIGLLLAGCTIDLKKVGIRPILAQRTSSLSFNPSTISKVAVLVQNERSYRLPRAAGRLIEDEFISVLLSKGYTIASRSDVELIRDEMKFQQSGLTDKGAAEVGKMLNVPAVLIVSVTQFEGKSKSYRLTKKTYRYYVTRAAMGARLISVEKGEVLWIGNHNDEYPSEHRGGTEALSRLARTIATGFPDRLQSGQKESDKDRQ